MAMTNKQLALIHVIKREFKLDDDTYRDTLEAQAGVRSAKDLDYRGFLAVMRHFEAAGFKSGHRAQGSVVSLSAPSSRPRGASENRPGMATVKQIKKIYALWWTLEGSWYRPGKNFAALRGFLRKRFRVEHENFLTFEKAGKVIESIKAIGSRSRLKEGRDIYD